MQIEYRKKAALALLLVLTVLMLIGYPFRSLKSPPASGSSQSSTRANQSSTIDSQGPSATSNQSTTTNAALSVSLTALPPVGRVNSGSYLDRISFAIPSTVSGIAPGLVYDSALSIQASNVAGPGFSFDTPQIEENGQQVWYIANGVRTAVTNNGNYYLSSDNKRFYKLATVWEQRNSNGTKIIYGQSVTTAVGINYLLTEVQERHGIKSQIIYQTNSVKPQDVVLDILPGANAGRYSLKYLYNSNGYLSEVKLRDATNILRAKYGLEYQDLTATQKALSNLKTYAADGVTVISTNSYQFGNDSYGHLLQRIQTGLGAVKQISYQPQALIDLQGATVYVAMLQSIDLDDGLGQISTNLRSYNGCKLNQFDLGAECEQVSDKEQILKHSTDYITASREAAGIVSKISTYDANSKLLSEQSFDNQIQSGVVYLNALQNIKSINGVDSKSRTELKWDYTNNRLTQLASLGNPESNSDDFTDHYSYSTNNYAVGSYNVISKIERKHLNSSLSKVEFSYDQVSSDIRSIKQWINNDGGSSQGYRQATIVTDTLGRLSAAITPSGLDIAVSGYADGFSAGVLVADPQALNFQNKYQYDALGNIKTVESAAGIKTRLVRDNLGRVVSVQQSAAGQPTQILADITYGAFGSVQDNWIEKNQNGKRTRTYFDGLGRAIQSRKVLDSLSQSYSVSKIKYEPDQGRIKTTLPVADNSANFSVVGSTESGINFNYDPINGFLKDITPDVIGFQSGQYQISYLDPATSSVVTPAGNKLDFSIKPLGMELALQGPSTRTSFRVLQDLANFESQIINQSNATFKTKYNTVGDILSAKDLSGSTNSYRYDLAGNLVEIKEQAGNKTVIAYDKLSRITDLQSYLPNGQADLSTKLQIFYDQSLQAGYDVYKGLEAGRETINDFIKWGYNWRGEITRLYHLDKQSNQQFEFSFEYGPDGLTLMRAPHPLLGNSVMQVSIEYLDGFQASFKSPNLASSSNPEGIFRNVLSRGPFGPVVIELENLYREEAIRSLNGTIKKSVITDLASNTNLLEQNFGYSANGESGLISKQTITPNSLRDEQFEYSYLKQLTKYTLNGASSIIEHDDHGRITKHPKISTQAGQAFDWSYNNPSSPYQASSFNSASSSLTQTFDQNRRWTARQLPNAPQLTNVSYDARGRLIQALTNNSSSIEISYGALGVPLVIKETVAGVVTEIKNYSLGNFKIHKRTGSADRWTLYVYGEQLDASAGVVAQLSATELNPLASLETFGMRAQFSSTGQTQSSPAGPGTPLPKPSPSPSPVPPDDTDNDPLKPTPEPSATPQHPPTPPTSGISITYGGGKADQTSVEPAAPDYLAQSSASTPAQQNSDGSITSDATLVTVSGPCNDTVSVQPAVVNPWENTSMCPAPDYSIKQMIENWWDNEVFDFKERYGDSISSFHDQGGVLEAFRILGGATVMTLGFGPIGGAAALGGVEGASEGDSLGESAVNSLLGAGLGAAFGAGSKWVCMGGRGAYGWFCKKASPLIGKAKQIGSKACDKVSSGIAICQEKISALLPRSSGSTAAKGPTISERVGKEIYVAQDDFTVLHNSNVLQRDYFDRCTDDMFATSSSRGTFESVEQPWGFSAGGVVDTYIDSETGFITSTVGRNLRTSMYGPPHFSPAWMAEQELPLYYTVDLNFNTKFNTLNTVCDLERLRSGGHITERAYNNILNSLARFMQAADRSR